MSPPADDFIAVPRSVSQRSARSKFGPPLNLADLPKAASFGEHAYTPSTTSYLLQKRGERGPFNRRTHSVLTSSTGPTGVQTPPVFPPVFRGKDLRSKSVGDIRKVVSQRGFNVRPTKGVEASSEGVVDDGGIQMLSDSVGAPISQIESEESSAFGSPTIGHARRSPAAPPLIVENNDEAVKGIRGPFEVPTDLPGEDDYLPSDTDSGFISLDETSDDSDFSSDSDGDFELQVSPVARRKRSTTEEAAAAALQDLEINIRVLNSQRHAVVLRFYP